jgi:flagellar motor switch protein FliN/FliY
MGTQDNHQAARAFAGAFAESLAASLTQSAGHAWQLEVLQDQDLSTQPVQAIQFRLTMDGSLRGSFFVEFYEPQVRELASQIAGGPVAAFGDEHAEALRKVISAAMDGLPAAEHGAFTFKVDPAEGLAFEGMLHVPLMASDGDQPGMPVALYFDSKLSAALSSQPATGDGGETENASIDPLNLKLVMDVELNVSLRFGQRQLPLREVLELTSGSVIELDRQVDDPVELMLDGKVIARGEAVIVDGNYGLRVTEIPQPMSSYLVR